MVGRCVDAYLTKKSLVMRVNIQTNVQNSRLDYTVAYLDQHPLKPAATSITVDEALADCHIGYGKQGYDYYIPRLGLVFDGNHTDLQLVVNAYQTDGGLEVLGIGTQFGEGAFCSGGAFGFDLLETIFYHVTRYEEVFCSKEYNGQTGWLREDRHYLVRHGLEKTAVVDRLVAAFFAIVTGRVVEHKTTYSISHDIDILYRFRPWTKIVRNLGAIVIHRRGWQHLMATIRLLLAMGRGRAKDPYDVYDWLFTIDNHLYKHKTLYMMAGGTTYYDNRYKITDPAAQRIIRLALDRGYSLGLHPSYDAGLTLAMSSEQKAALESAAGHRAILNRQHWLRWFWDRTPDIITANGMSNDSSLGYNDRLGFRCGTGFPYRLYDFARERTYEWTELPMAYMESSLIHESKRTGRSMTEIHNDFIKSNRQGTHIEMNWHNSNFDPTMWHGAELTALCHELAQKLQV